MKRQPDMDKESFASILPDYGKRKLMTYADSIRELALNLEDNGNEEPGDKECREAVDRRAILWQKKLSENKSLMVDQQDYDGACQREPEMCSHEQQKIQTDRPCL